MTPNVMFWGQIGWFVALAFIGVGIWFFKARKPPRSD
jgi:hypothetical protein